MSCINSHPEFTVTGGTEGETQQSSKSNHQLDQATVKHAETQGTLDHK